MRISPALPTLAAAPAAITKAAAPAQTEAVAADTVSVSSAEPSPAWSGVKAGARTLGLNVLDVAKYGALIGATAAAPVLFGPAGVLLSAGGAAAGYALHYKMNGQGDDAWKAAQVGAVVGALGSAMGSVAGPAGIGVMAAVGATGAIISKVVNWSEGWSRDGQYFG